MRPARRRAAWLAGLWTLVLWVGCSIPGSEIPEVRLLAADKLAHVFLFAVFAVLWARAAPGRWVAIAGGGLGFGVFTEVWQHLLPIGRTGDPFDVVADAVGLAVGLGAVWGAARRSRAPV